MRLSVPLLIATACVTGCTQKEESTEVTSSPGRYQGIGVYGAGSGWARITVPPPADGSRLATLADDDHVIVITDSQTGEVRQCGDLSGYCITLNRWSQALDDTRAAPVKLEPLRDEKGKAISPSRTAQAVMTTPSATR